ncbi:MAG: type II secretion system F family protein [Desulfobacterales bacterium]|nr:type II secretion system F family protein [Desulfobacterales bacterium]
MPSYRCTFMTPQGTYETRAFTAVSKADLKWRLEQEGHFVYKIDRKDRIRFAFPKAASRKIRLRDFFSFNKEFAVLIRTGLPIVSALDAITAKSNPSQLNTILQQVRHDVSTGESLSEAFAKYPVHFSGLYVSTLQAGERSGNIPDALEKHTEYLKNMMALRRKLITASVYPLILTLAASGVLLLLLIWVVPSFTQTYSESDTPLPAMTTMLIAFSNMIRNHMVYLVIAGGALLIGFQLALRREGFRLRVDQLLLRLPYTGRVYRSYATAMFTRTVSMILSAGATLIEAVGLAAGALNNRFLQSHMTAVVARITEGYGFSEALEETGQFPHLAVRMIAAGESGGELEQVLNDAAEFYDDEVAVMLAALSAGIEPALMLLMGLLIGFIVLAMYLPIFQLAGTVF